MEKTFKPIWYSTIKPCIEYYKKGDILVASDTRDDGAKKITFFPNTKILEDDYVHTFSENTL